MGGKLKERNKVYQYNESVIALLFHNGVLHNLKERGLRMVHTFAGGNKFF